MTDKEFASKLRVMRALYRWSQQDLAKKLGVTATYISLLETGKRTPSWGFVKKFARATGQEIRTMANGKRNGRQTARANCGHSNAGVTPVDGLGGTSRTTQSNTGRRSDDIPGRGGADSMRKTFPKIVERGRVLTGGYGSNPGDTFGAFVVRRPPVGPDFKILVGDGLGWDHVSVSMHRRTPTWDEMCWIKNLFFDPNECVVQYHPPAEVYVNFETTCLHLWRPQGENVLMPPLECV